MWGFVVKCFFIGYYRGCEIEHHNCICSTRKKFEWKIFFYKKKNAPFVWALPAYPDGLKHFYKKPGNSAPKCLLDRQRPNKQAAYYKGAFVSNNLRAKYLGGWDATRSTRQPNEAKDSSSSTCSSSPSSPSPFWWAIIAFQDLFTIKSSGDSEQCDHAHSPWLPEQGVYHQESGRSIETDC